MAPTSSAPSLNALKGKLPFIGLTGGIGSGKTAVSDLLGELGAGIIDTDQIAREITAPGGKAIPLIQKAFGSDFINASGALDRVKMRVLVFENPQSRTILEQITHPLIREETRSQATDLIAKGLPYLVFVIPLLVESEAWQALIDWLVVVDCPEETQIARVMQRSNLSRAEVERILNAQASRKERLSLANTVIENTGDLASLKEEVLFLHQKILLSLNAFPSSS